MKKSTLFALVGLIILSGFFQSCLTTKPRCKKDEVSDTTGRYHVITIPYYKKKANFVGSLFVLAAAGGTAAAAYKNSVDIENQVHLNQGENNANIYGGGGLISGYLVAKIMMAIIGNHKIIDVDNYSDLPKWVISYNKRNGTDYVMIKDSLLCSPATLWIIPANKEKSFLPKNFQDVKNFSNTFPNSDYSNQVITAANKILSKSELKKMERIYPNNSAITESKVIYVAQSKSESEFFESLNEFPDIQTKVEKEYADIVSSYFYAIDFVKRYPSSNYVDSVFSHTTKNCNHMQLDSMIKYFSSSCKKNTLLDAELIYIQQCSGIDELLAAVKKYPLTRFPISVFDDYSTFEKANKIQSEIVRFKPTIKGFNTNIIIDDLRLKYLTSAIENNKGNGDEMKALLNHLTNENWLKDSSVNGLIEKIALETAVSNGEDYFTGKRDSIGAYTGFGTLYTSNKRILTGNFQHGKLNGIGKMIYPDGDLYEGNFIDNELNGNNCVHKLSSGILRGDFAHNSLNGKGEFILNNGTKMKGEFTENKLNGFGEELFENGPYYIGEFKQGKFSGKGKYYWQIKDSTKYFEGEFLNGKRNGVGVFYFSNDIQIKGNWKNDCPEGTMNIIKESKSDSMENFKISINFNNCEADLNSKHFDEGNGDFDEKDLLIKVTNF